MATSMEASMFIMFSMHVHVCVHACMYAHVCLHGALHIPTPTHTPIHPPHLPPWGVTPQISLNVITLKWIKIFQFCLKIWNMCRLPHLWVGVLFCGLVDGWVFLLTFWYLTAYLKHLSPLQGYFSLNGPIHPVTHSPMPSIIQYQFLPMTHSAKAPFIMWCSANK